MPTNRVYVHQIPKGWQAFWHDPSTGKRRTKMVHSRSRRDAEREAAKIEKSLQAGQTLRRMSWDLFREKVSDEYLVGKKRSTRDAYSSALSAFERTVGTPDLNAITASTISRLQSGLWSSVRPASVRSYLTHIRALLQWAHEMGWLSTMPTIKLPSVPQEPKGRSITDAEVDTLVAVAEAWDASKGYSGLARVVRTLRFSGLRIGEVCQLSWDSPPVQLVIDAGRTPHIEWHPDGHKATRVDRTPITQDMFKLVQDTPASERIGRVFPVRHNGKTLARDRLGKVISAIGKESGIQTPAGTVTAHDLRRAFGTAMAKTLKPVDLMRIMRHRNIQTTLAYYVDQDLDELGAAVWRLNSG